MYTTTISRIFSKNLERKSLLLHTFLIWRKINTH